MRAHLRPGGSMAFGDDVITQVVRERFRSTELSADQRAVITRLLAGESLLLSAPPGWGRGLCWQVAAAVRGGPVLVVAPRARTLAERAERLAQPAGLVACHLDAARAPAVVDALRAQLSAGHYDVVLAPVRQLSDPRVRATALAARPALVVIEETDAFIAGGRAFEPASVHVTQLLTDLGRPQVLALAQTAEPRALEDISERLGVRLPHPVIAHPLPADTRLEVRLTRTSAESDAHLLALLDAGPERAVVLVATRAEAERLAEMVADECRVSAEATHGVGPGPAEALRRFREGGTRVLLATIAPDRDERWPEVPLIVHYSLPPSLDHWRHACLLAGGNRARCVLLCDRNERPRLERRAWQCAPEPGHLLALYHAIEERDGQRVYLAELARLTGLQPDGAHLGLEALIEVGALSVRARGDDWIEAGTLPLSPTGLTEYAVRADGVRRRHLAQIDEVIDFCLTRRCRRAWLADALGLESEVTAQCRCDRCAPEEKKSRRPLHASTYPLRVEDFRGRALALYPRPGHDVPTDLPARLSHALKYDHDPDVAARLAYVMAQEVRRRTIFRGCQVVVPIPCGAPADAPCPAAVLAEAVARLLGWPLAHVLVVSGSRAPREDQISAMEKFPDVADTFVVVNGDAIRERVVLLVDDVFDSGATMYAAATALRAAGARDVRLLTAVRTTLD